MALTSASITTGGTAQAALPANPARHGFYVQNTSSADMRINPDAAASSTVGILLRSGALYEAPLTLPASGVISVWGATTGQTYTCGDW